MWPQTIKQWWHETHILPSELSKLTILQFSSVPQSCPTLCDPMDYSTPGLPVHHQLPEFTQTHVHWVSAAIQPSHPLLSPSHPTCNLSQDQGLFCRFLASGGQRIGVSASTSVLPMNTQDWFPLGWTGWISFESKGLSRVFSNTTVYGVGVNHSHKGDMYSRHIPGACSLRLCTQRGGKTCPQTLNFQHQTQFLSVKWVDVDEWKSGLGCLRLSYTSYKSNVFPSPLPPL